jgi:lipid II:glycine glycyltransferase (peptidoglycan interpeptide bridge formation enzyme)
LSGLKVRGYKRFVIANDRLSTRIVHGISTDDARAWDDFVESVEQSDVAQLHAWSRFRSAAGFSAVHVLTASHGELVGGAQVLTRRVPVIGAVGYVSGGPLLATHVISRDVVAKEICRALASLRRSVRLLFVQPPAESDVVSAELHRLGFRPSDAGIAPAASVRVDLRVSEDELRSNLNRRLQRWTRQWPKRGVTVRTGSADDLPLLADLMSRSAQHQRYSSMSLEYLRDFYNELAPGGSAVLFIGELDGQPVAANLMTYSGGMLRERLIGLDRNSDGAKLSVPAAITWNAMQWARDRGCAWYDFGGLSPDLARARLAGGGPDEVTGPERHKLLFGGVPYVLPTAMELAHPAPLRFGYDLARRSKRGEAALSNIRRRMRTGKAKQPA